MTFHSASIRFAVCAAATAWMVGCSGTHGSGDGAVGASAEALHSDVSGDWANATPCVTSSYDPLTGAMKCDGYTAWTGSFTGTSHYFFVGTVDLVSGDVNGTLSETFTGSGPGPTDGSFHMTETITIVGSTGALHIDSTIDSGTDDFAHASGQLTFDGTSTPIGQGAGTYAGYVNIP